MVLLKSGYRAALERRALRSGLEPIDDLARRLEAMPAGQRHLVVGNGSAGLHPLLAPALCDRSFELRFTNPTKAMELARLALAACERLALPAGVLATRLETEVRAHIANAHRVLGEYAPAARKLAEVARLRASLGGEDPGLEALCAGFAGSLRLDQGRTFAAITHYLRSYELRRAHDDLVGANRDLVAIGCAYARAGRSRPAVAWLGHALSSLDPREEPLLCITATMALIEIGGDHWGPGPALRILGKSRRLVAAKAPPLILLRFRWLEAKLLLDMGDLEVASNELESVRQAMIEANTLDDVVIVSADLMHAKLEAGQLAEVRDLGAETLSMARALGMPKEALRILGTLARVYRRGEVEADVIDGLAALRARRGQLRLA